jgi:hypothetical protein
MKLPGETVFSNAASAGIMGKWVRVKFGTDVQFVGRFEDQIEIVSGNATLPGGTQKWMAAGGLRILQKIILSKAVFAAADNSLKTVEWMPAMNKRDRRGLLVGNRIATAISSAYYYGGASLWTHRQYIDYLIKNFIQQTGGPTWTLGGQTDLLDGMTTTIDFQAAGSVADALRQLIPVRFGVDWQVKPTTGGFEINVFALNAVDCTVAGVTWPKNTTILAIKKTDYPNLVEAHVVESGERKVDRIEVVGKRIVVCGSLHGARSVPTLPATLVPKWGSTIETDYIGAGGLVSGDPTAGPTEFDQVRKQEKYRDVYQKFGAPSDWALDTGAWSVKCNDDGTLTTGDYQTSIRETLSWTPMKEGFDYSTDPATDNTTGEAQQDMKPPLAWLLDEIPETTPPTPVYVPVESAGIHAAKPFQEWGVVLNGSPNHVLCLNHWTDAQLDTSDLDYLRYDYDTAIATIAIESDHRIRLAYNMPDELKAGDGTVMTILDEGAELWVLLANTVIGADMSGDGPGSFITSGSSQRVLRNDSDRMALLLAGTLSRYINDRARSKLTFKGQMAWAGKLGTILSVYQFEDGDTQSVGAVVTSIEWTAGKSPQTVVSTGYA